MTKLFCRPATGRLAATALAASTLGLLSFTPVLSPATCKQLLLEAYHKLEKPAQEGKGTLHLQFTSTSVYTVPGQRASQESTVHGEFYAQGRKGFFQMEDMRVWQDGQYVATVLPTQRTVVLTRAVPGQAAADPKRFLGVRDSLIQLGTVQACKNEQVGPQTQQHIQLAYRGAVASRLQLNTLDFWLGPQQTLQRMRIHYSPGSALTQVTVRFLAQEWLASSANIPADARAQVVDAQGRLLPAYRGYHLRNQITPGR